jgi:hypothetical protein
MKSGIDYNKLDKTLNTPKMIKVADVQDKLEKVGFGVVRFKDDANKLNLWQVNKAEDGTEYIEALYEDKEEVVKNSWTIEIDSFKKSATIFYKETPIKNVVFAELGFDSSEADDFKKYLPERLASNKDLVKSMVNSLDESYKNKVYNKHPELFQ